MILRFLGAQWLAAGFVGLVSLGVSTLIARTLGPELFGVYSIVFAAGAVMGTFIDGGFGKLLQRERAFASPNLAVYGRDLHGMACGHELLMTAALSMVAVILFPNHAMTGVAAIIFFLRSS